MTDKPTVIEGSPVARNLAKRAADLPLFVHCAKPAQSRPWNESERSGAFCKPAAPCTAAGEGTDFQSGAPKRRRARADERAFAGLPSARGVHRGGVWYRIGASRHPVPAGLQAARLREAVGLRMRLQCVR